MEMNGTIGSVCSAAVAVNGVRAGVSCASERIALSGFLLSTGLAAGHTCASAIHHTLCERGKDTISSLTYTLFFLN